MSRQGSPWRGSEDARCESCGYAIVGLPAGARCPECGRPTGSSGASLRRGTPYQRVQRLDRVWESIRLTLLEPGVVWANARPIWHSSWRLQNITLLCASVGYGMGAGFFAHDGGVARYRFPAQMMLGMLAAVPCFVVLFLLAAGIRGMLRVMRREEGFDDVLAATVVGHAAAGLVPGAATAWACGVVMDLVRASAVVYWVGQLACWALGVAWFLVAVAGGASEMRYANRDAAWLKEEVDE